MSADLKHRRGLQLNGESFTGALKAVRVDISMDVRDGRCTHHSRGRALVVLGEVQGSLLQGVAECYEGARSSACALPILHCFFLGSRTIQPTFSVLQLIYSRTEGDLPMKRTDEVWILMTRARFRACVANRERL